MTQGLPPVLPLPLAQTPMCGCVLKRRANLTGQERFRLRDLLRYNLRTARAYLLKEDFQQFWEYESPSWAGKFLDEWCCQVMRSRIQPMKKIARTLRSHRTLILNYFRDRKQYYSGVVEGLNKKVKLTERKSYGFRTFHVTETALYHARGKLPEPDVAHRFFCRGEDDKPIRSLWFRAASILNSKSIRTAGLA